MVRRGLQPNDSAVKIRREMEAAFGRRMSAPSQCYDLKAARSDVNPPRNISTCLNYNKALAGLDHY
jgi:hypothetical protein